jgi:hypothetical protein
MLIGGFIGFIIGNYLKDNPDAIYFPKYAVWIFFIFLYPIYFLAIGIHELGHAAAGISQNFEFKMYVVGPFMFEKEGETWKYKWNKSFNLSGGLALCLPNDDHNLIKRFSIFIAGGPVASLLSAVLSFLIYRVIGAGDSYSYLHNIIALFFLIYTFLSTLIFLMTIIPFSTGGLHSDGARLIRFLKGGDISKLEVFVVSIFSGISAGIRPKDYNMSEILDAKQLSNKLNDNFEVYFDGFLFQHTFDNNQLVEAEMHLENYLANAEKVPEGFRGSLWLDAAFFYAYGKKDLAKAQEYYNMYKHSSMVPKAQVFATEAALHKLEMKPAEMNQKIHEALAEIPAMIDKGLGKAMKERLERMID